MAICTEKVQRRPSAPAKPWSPHSLTQSHDRMVVGGTCLKQKPQSSSMPACHWPSPGVLEATSPSNPSRCLSTSSSDVLFCVGLQLCPVVSSCSGYRVGCDGQTKPISSALQSLEGVLVGLPEPLFHPGFHHLCGAQCMRHVTFFCSTCFQTP